MSKLIMLIKANQTNQSITLEIHNMRKITSFLLLAFLLSAFSASSQSRGILLAPVKIDGKWGYIDKTGKIAINPQFDRAGSFKEGLARIQLGGKCGFIGKTGKIAINPQFDDARWFQEGLAGIKLGDKWGYIDKSGKIAIKLQF